MSLVKERNNKTNITRYYNLEQVSSNLSAAEWISSVRSISGVDSRSNLVYLTIRKRMPADVELIEKTLKLV